MSDWRVVKMSAVERRERAPHPTATRFRDNLLHDRRAPGCRPLLQPNRRRSRRRAASSAIRARGTAYCP